MSKDKREIEPTACYLVCLQKSHDDILLRDGLPVMIGRSPVTRIQDPRCSRNQVEITADWKSQKVKVRQVGGNASAIDGEDIGQEKVCNLKDSSTLFILSGQYPHKVVFAKARKDAKKGSTESSVNDKHTKRRDSHAGDSEKKVLKDSVKEKLLNSTGSNGKDSVKTSNEKGKKVDNEHSQKSSTSNKTESSSKSSKKRSHDDDIDHHRDSKKKKSDNCRADEEHVKSIAAKLEQMKKDEGVSEKSLKKTTQDKRSSSSSSQSTSDKNASSASAKNLSKVKAEAESDKWVSHDQIHVFTSKGVVPSSKIASFDMDGTIILTKSGKKFPTDHHDWRIAYPEIPGKLKKLVRDGFKIVFFTNQLGVAKGRIKIEDLKQKVENVVHGLQVPVQVFIATHEGKYRKPSDGMWKLMAQQYNCSISVDKDQSVFVGDAAGRPANWAPKKPKDFSLSDRLFALNVGVTFHTPEEFFKDQKAAPFNMPAFDPRKLESGGRVVPKDCTLASRDKEVLILVGFPACGKSHLANNVLKPEGYEVINRDTLRSWQKCVQKTKEALVNSKVVIDNTNLTKEERGRYVACAKESGVPCRCFVFNTTIEHCRHNERFRQLMDKSHAKINEMIFNATKSKFEEPNMTEGFSEIVNVNFVPRFQSASQESEYKKFLLEK